MENMKVKNIIIGKQFEDSENLHEFFKIVNKKKMVVNIVEAGDRINIEKNLYFDILWPSSSNMIFENLINNNSIVCKMYYKEFSMLFTGDIEEEAEKKIIKMHSESILKSTCLKIAHHGSKSSSTIELLKKIDPKIALIGVGKDNKFGHPSNEVIKKLEKLRC